MKRTISLAAVLFLVCGSVRIAEAQSHFYRGDPDRNGTIELTDGVFTLNWLFLGGSAPDCLDGADFDDSGVIDLGDPIQIFNFLFLGGPPPRAPWPVIDKDPTDDDGLSCLPEIVDHTGDITADETWVAGVTHRLVSAVRVGDGATLTIEPGVTVLGDSATQGLLIVARGGRLIANGTPSAPIIFTSDKPAGERGRGDWGGLLLLGRGDNNVLPDKEALAEGLENEFWGGASNVIPDDDSGSLSYVRVEFGGTEISPDNEVNAISLLSCGSQTTLDHVMVKYNLDDGFEWFGGAASLKYGLAVGIGDDSFDYSFGCNFVGQHWVGQQRGDDADRGFEVDGNEFSFGNAPFTRPTISNVTLIGDPDLDEGEESTWGINLRRGTGTILYNLIVTGFKSGGMDLDDAATTENEEPGVGLIVDHSVFHNNGADGTSHYAMDDETGFQFTTVEFMTNLMMNNVVATEPPVVDPYNLAAPNFRPQNDALTNAFDATTLGDFFDAAPYKGGVPPDGEDWTQARWISYAGN